MDEKSLIFSYLDFPFDKLVLDSNLSNIKPAKEGDLHINTFILEKNILHKYNINFDCPLKSYSISYYIGKADPKGENPSFYFHPVLHPRWTDKDKNGKNKKTISQLGESIENFWIQFRCKIEELLNNIEIKLKAKILGPENSKKTSNYITDVVKFPLKENVENTEQSKSFCVKLFSVDSTDTSKIYNTTVKDDHIRVPGTKWKIFTQIYDISEDSKTSRQRILNYNDFKPFNYNPQSHIYTNASNQRLYMTLEMMVKSPVLHTKKNEANLQITAQKISFTRYQLAGGIKEIPYDETLAILQRRDKYREELGDNEDVNGGGGEDYEDNNGYENNGDNQSQQVENENLKRKLSDAFEQQESEIQPLIKKPRTLIKANNNGSENSKSLITKKTSKQPVYDPDTQFQ
jgi:hypothetical protein